MLSGDFLKLREAEPLLQPGGRSERGERLRCAPGLWLPEDWPDTWARAPSPLGDAKSIKGRDARAASTSRI